MAGKESGGSKTPPQQRNYEAEHIKHLGDIEGIRKNAGMYVGGYNIDAMHHLVNEIVDNAVDEFGQGRGDIITITLHADDSISIADNGAGIPVKNAEGGVPAVQLIFTKLHAGGKFDKDGSGAYHRSGGLHGVGATAVNALSEWLECIVDRHGKKWRIAFARGIVTEALKEIGDSNRTGTVVRFKPDALIFKTNAEGDEISGPLVFNFKRLAGRMRELAFLNAGLKIIVIDERNEDEEPLREEFKADSGLAGYVQMLAGTTTDDDEEEAEAGDEDGESADDEGGDEAGEETAEAEADTAKKKSKKKKKRRGSESRTPIIQITGDLDNVSIDIAMQYTDADGERLEGYCNNIHTVDGGKHVEGFRTGVAHTFKEKSKQLDELEAAKGGKKTADDKKKKVETRPDDFRYGLTAVVSVKVADPQFHSQNKTKLMNTEVSGIVQRFVNEQLGIHLEEHPEITRRVRDIAMQAAKIRDAMKKAKEAVKKGQSAFTSKLHPCRSKDPNTTELFLVEGDSASGTAKAGRDANFQAILPLRGKILNVEKAKMHKMLGHREINELIRHIGTGITGDATLEFNEKNRKYHKIIIMTDADVDGSHIRTLLLTFFFRQMKPLIEKGHIYIAQPPLYHFSSGKGGGGKKKGKSDSDDYIYSDKDRDAKLLRFGLQKATLRVRAKGAPAEVSIADLKEGQFQKIDGTDLKNLLDLVTRVEEIEREFLDERGLTVEQMLHASLDPKTGAIDVPLYFVVEKGVGRILKDDAARDEYLLQFAPPPEPDKPAAEAEVEGDGKVEIDVEGNGKHADLPQAPPIHEFPKRRREKLKEAFEKISGYGAKYGYTLEQLSVPDVQLLVGSAAPAPFGIESGSQVVPAFSLLHALRSMRNVGKQGLNITRFKGLGEMNADQLRETTMEPELRKLKQVQLDDVLEAEELFAVLMGTNVRDRYNFIQKEAPRARLDV